MQKSSIRFTPKILSISHASDPKSNQFGIMTIAIPRELLGDDLSIDTISKYSFEVIATPRQQYMMKCPDCKNDIPVSYVGKNCPICNYLISDEE